MFSWKSNHLYATNEINCFKTTSMTLSKSEIFALIFPEVLSKTPQIYFILSSNTGQLLSKTSFYNWWVVVQKKWDM